MAIEFSCNQCQKTLRVPDEHLGKKARCPNCQAICQIETNTPSVKANLSEATEPELYPSSSAGENLPNPYASRMQDPQFHSGHARSALAAPHRGALVLTLGIMSLFLICFFVPGILAWIFGSSDLKQMKAGMMDPDGHSLTQVGMILGIIGTLIPVAIALFYILFIVVAIILAIASGV